jgi:hypothetical protein
MGAQDTYTALFYRIFNLDKSGASESAIRIRVAHYNSDSFDNSDNFDDLQKACPCLH